MKAFLILEDGTVFTGTSIGSTRDMISEIVFNTSMTGYLEVLTDPSYAGQAVVMTYPLIGNYGITPDMESRKAWPDGYIVRELSRMPSNFRCEGTIQDFLKEQDIPGIAGVDTRALTKILREKGTMNGMITTNENYNLEEILPKLKAYTVGDVVSKVTCSEKYVLEGTGKKVALLDLGAKNNIAKSLNQRGCEVTVYPAHTTAEEIMSHRLHSCRQLSDAFGIAVLKGRNTLVSDEGRITVIDEGSPALATAGSGDVLSGAIGALLAAGCSPFEAASGGALLHATAGSLLMERGKESGVLAREIADTMSECIHNTAALI